MSAGRRWGAAEQVRSGSPIETRSRSAGGQSAGRRRGVFGAVIASICGALLLAPGALAAEGGQSSKRPSEGALGLASGLLETTGGLLETTGGLLGTTSGLLETTEGTLGETTKGLLGEGSTVQKAGESALEAGKEVVKSGEGVVESGKGVVESGKGVVEEGKGVVESGKEVVEEGKGVVEGSGSPTPSPSPSKGQGAPAGAGKGGSSGASPKTGTSTAAPSGQPQSAQGHRTGVSGQAPSATISHPQRTSSTSKRSRAGRRSRAVAGTSGAASSVAHAGAGSSSHSGSRGKRSARRASGTQSPLSTTITKIVAVVPLPVRIAIGVLLLLAAALGVRSWLAATRARRLEQQREELLGDVGLLQRALLPEIPAKVGSVATSVAYRPADGPAAGGDFYDVFPLAEGEVAIVVGDLSGHGRQALQHTALMRFTLRTYLEAGLGPRETLKMAGVALERRLGGSLATVIVATYEPQERTLTYAGAGHPPPLVLGARPDAAEQGLAPGPAGRASDRGSAGDPSPAGDRGSAGRPRAPEQPQTPSFSACVSPVTVVSSPLIGAGMKTGVRETTIAIPGACQICFYTDGVTDARVGSELYGERRLERALSQLGAQASAQALIDRVASEADARPDDMAACLLFVEGGSKAPTKIRERLSIDDGMDAGAVARAERFLLACGIDRDQTGETLAALRDRKGPTLLQVDTFGEAPKVSLRSDETPSLQPLYARATAMELSL